MIAREEAIRILELFNLMADRLETSKLRAWMISPDLKGGVSARLVGDEWHIEWDWPEDEESVGYYLLTLRMFVQEGDEISVHGISRCYYSLGLEGDLLDRLSLVRKRWLHYLKRNSTLVSGLPLDPVGYTNRQVIGLLLNGDLAHVDLDQRSRFESWVSNVGGRALLQNQVLEILEYLHVGIRLLRDLHAEILGGIERAAIPTAVASN